MENLTTMMSTSTWGYTGKAWIGLTATLKWAWVDGEEATYYRWMPLEPDKSNNLCVMIEGGFWFDVSCSLIIPSVCFDGGYKRLL